MRPSYLLLLQLALLLSACTANSISTPTASVGPPIPTSAALVSPTASAASEPNPTITPLPTLQPARAEEEIRRLLGPTQDCAAPCFWGIIPGQTNLTEAKGIFTQLGHPISYTYIKGAKEFDSVEVKIGNGPSVTPILTVRDQVVQNLRIDIDPEQMKPGEHTGWLAYSPETLIRRYGLPSKIEIFADWGPIPAYALTMYFDKLKLIVTYDGSDSAATKRSTQICPRSGRFDFVSLWMGDDPEDPPLAGLPIQQAASMSVEDFAKLVTNGTPEACIKLNGEAFP